MNDLYVGRIRYGFLTGDSELGVAYLKVGNSKTSTLTINPTPSDAIVVINGEERTSIEVENGSNVTYSVSKEGYVVTESSVVVNQDMTIDVVLKKIPRNYVDVEDYEYTLGNDEVTLTSYIGTEPNVVAPTVQVEE